MTDDIEAQRRRISEGIDRLDEVEMMIFSAFLTALKDENRDREQLSAAALALADRYHAGEDLSVNEIWALHGSAPIEAEATGATA